MMELTMTGGQELTAPGRQRAARGPRDLKMLVAVVALAVTLACCVLFLALAIPASPVASPSPATASSATQALERATWELSVGHNRAAEKALAQYQALAD